MPARFVTVDRDTPMLLPPSLHEWVPADHLVHFVIDAVEQLDLGSARVNERGSGSKQYPPATMLALLSYSYATGTFASRRIEQSTFDNVAVRYLCGDTHPDHDTICAFRCENRVLLASAFAQILELAARSGQLRVGDLTVAIDGTKILASASRHSAVSYERAGEQLRQVELEIEQLLAKADAADSTPLQDGLTINDELTRRHTRKAALARARAEMEARAYAKAQAERAEKHPDRPGPPPPVPPKPKDQYNYTDPDSRIMPAGGQGRFEQAYNAQAAVEIDSRLIVGQHVTQATNDKAQLVPTVAALVPLVASAVKEVLVDSGFVSEDAITQLEFDKAGQRTGLTVLAAVQRERHGRTIAQLEARPDPSPPPADAPFLARLAHRTATRAGRARYKQRQQTIEPVFGIIKAGLGFRRFLLRGLQNVSLEWSLVCSAYNLKRLHAVGTVLPCA
jgi:transposase